MIARSHDELMTVSVCRGMIKKSDQVTYTFLCILSHVSLVIVSLANSG